jgi:hypothetical protein
MSKTTLASLQTQVTELTSQFAALLTRLDAHAAAAAPVTPEKQKKQKKPRDPDAPKRTAGAYVLFCAAERAKTPELKLSLTELGERWRALSDAQKASFKPAAAAPAAAPAKSAKSPSETKGPKRALNPFMRFQAKRRGETPDTKLTAKQLGEEWKALSAEEQAEYKTPPASDAESSDDGADTSDAE